MTLHFSATSKKLQVKNYPSSTHKYIQHITKTSDTACSTKLGMKVREIHKFLVCSWKTVSGRF